MLNKQEIRLLLGGKYKKKRMELKEKFIIHLRSVYKELHADHETGLLTTKQAEYQAPGKCEIFSLFCCPGFPKGCPLWHTTLLAKCSVLYALSALLRKCGCRWGEQGHLKQQENRL